jgi:6-phosphogluconolactonase (cycloisomerase 2 family)
MRGLLTIMMGVGVVSPMMYAAELTNGSGTVFVMTNNADKNEVVAYERASDGTFFESNRYDTEGRGSGGVNDPLEAQGSLTLSPDHSLLFAVNAGSGNVSVFRVHRGTLSLADKTPSGGSQPVAVAQSQDFVYVLNSGGSGSVVGFHFDNDGRFRPIKNSTAFLTANVTGGASITISPNGQFLAVTERLANNIDTFQIKADGTLAPIVVNPSPAPGAFSANFAPDGKLLVSETGPAGAVNASAISSYSVQSNGTLAAVSQSIPTFGGANCWNAITPDGKRVYISNAGSSTISGFAIGKGGALTPIGATVVGSNPQGSGNLDIAVSGDGNYVYTLNSAGGTIGVFAIQHDGTLDNLGEIRGVQKSAGFNGIAAL